MNSTKWYEQTIVGLYQQVYEAVLVLKSNRIDLTLQSDKWVVIVANGPHRQLRVVVSDGYSQCGVNVPAWEPSNSEVFAVELYLALQYIQAWLHLNPVSERDEMAAEYGAQRRALQRDGYIG
jgi:hypothetical protein